MNDESSPSTSDAETLPVAVVVDASSVTAPVPSLPASTLSSAPVIVTVTTCVVESLAEKVYVSVTESPASSASVAVAVLSRVYVQVPLAITKLP